MDNLQVNFEELKKTPLPDFPENDFFDDWIIKLIELDAYIAGIASSRLEGDKQEYPDLNKNFKKLKKSLEEIQIGSDSDRAAYKSCADYLHKLERVLEQF